MSDPKAREAAEDRYYAALDLMAEGQLEKLVERGRAPASALRQQPENPSPGRESVRLDQDRGGFAPDQAARTCASRLAFSTHRCRAQPGTHGEASAGGVVPKAGVSLKTFRAANL